MSEHEARSDDTPESTVFVRGVAAEETVADPADPPDATLADAGDGGPTIAADDAEATIAGDDAEATIAAASTTADVAMGSAGGREPMAMPVVAGYEILGELGRGGMGVVYHARQVLLNRPCALKMILAGAHASPEATARFLAEAESVARVRHPNVVEIHHIGEAGGLPFFELEYVEGGSLDKRLDGTPWPPRQAAELVEALARGVAEAHRLGLVHRDLKPANVLIAGDGTPKVTDFGLAKAIDSEGGLTATESILGSPSYMAPEQAEGHAREAGPAADVYSLGAILYALLTGRPPFRGATVLQTLELVRTAEPVPPGRLVPGTPRDLETIGLKCLRKDPSRRYESAEALAGDLRRFLDGAPILARPVGPIERAWRWGRRRPALAGLLATIALLTAALVVGAFVFADGQRRIAERKTRLANERTAFAQEKEAARRDTAAKLYRAYLNQAAATVRAREPGYRRRVNAFLRDASALEVAEEDQDRGEVRALVAACLGDPIGLDPEPGGAVARAFSGRTRRDNVTVCARTPDDGLHAHRATATTIQLLRDDREKLGEVESPLGYIHDLAVGADGALLAAACDNGFAAWDLPERTPRMQVRVGTVYGVALDPTGRWLAARLGNGTVELWSLQVNRPEASYRFRDLPTGIAFDADGRHLLVSWGGGPTLAFPLRDTPERLQLAGHDGAVPGLAFRPDGRTLASVSKDRTLKFWDARTGEPGPSLAEFGTEVQCVAFSADGALVAVGDWRGVASVFEVESGRLLARAEPRIGANVWRLAFDPLDRFLAVVGGDGLALLPFERGPGTLRFEGPGTVDPALGGDDLAIHPRGLGLVVAQRGDGGLYRLDLDPDGRAASRPVQVVARTGFPILSLGFSTGGDRLYFLDASGGIGRYDWGASRLLATVGERVGRHLAVDPSGRWAASALGDGAILLTDLADGREVVRLPAGSVESWCLAWSPDGTRLAAGRPDGGVDLWDLEQVRARFDELGFDLPSFRNPGAASPPPGPSRNWWASGPTPPGLTLAFPRPGPRARSLPTSDVRRIGDPAFWAGRGEAAGNRGDWPEALRDYRKALALEPSNTVYWLKTAPLTLQVGEVGAYRDLARRMLERFGDTDDAMTAERIAKIGLLATPPDADLDRLTELADRAVRTVNDATLRPWCTLARGMAEFRAGRHETAAERLGEGLESGPPWACRLALLPYLAMAEHHLGRSEEARRHLDEADRALGPHFVAGSGYGWHDWLIADLARREARALIGR